ncbi:unnamed protein product, partial [marine sediment metagenome]
METKHSDAQSPEYKMNGIVGTPDWDDNVNAVSRIIKAIDSDPCREGLSETPERVVRSWQKLYCGYQEDPKAILGTTFDAGGYNEMIMLRNIEFYSTCEHHLLPFFGHATVAYIPRLRVVGISKIARVVEAFSRRLQIQERLTTQIADSIEKALEPLGVMVVLEAQHLCMVARGVEKQHSAMVTSVVRGL